VISEVKMAASRKAIGIFGIAAIVAIVAFVALSATASAADIFVGPGETYTSIQQAVDNATAGDTIIVRDGTYNENVDVNVAHITIRSENGSENCIVQAANSNDHVFDVTDLSTDICISTSPMTYSYNGTTYTSYLGNYWVDYSDVDADNNGIWNNPYSIDGDTDWHPLKEPFENYIYSSPKGDILFEDTFNELNQTKWILFGYPQPMVLAQVYGRQGVFDNMGDAMYPSGAVSIQNLALTNKLPIVIESEVYLDVMDIKGCWAYPTVGLTRENTPNPLPPGYEDYLQGLQFALQHVGYGCVLSPPDVRGHTYFYFGLLNETDVWEGIGSYENGGILADNCTNKWVRLAILINNDRTVEFYADGRLLYKSESEIHPTILEGKKFYLGSRSSGDAGKAYHDYVKVIVYSRIFDTDSPINPYPSVSGTHNGTITPSFNFTTSKLYTYSCAGTGGHTESIELYEDTALIASGEWEGYQGDWHNITITPQVTLQKDLEYRYVIRTGSYPQIVHAESKDVTGGTITCTEFTDVNGKRYEDRIPAIRLE
jgi:hypothetical protein